MNELYDKESCWSVTRYYARRAMLMSAGFLVSGFLLGACSADHSASAAESHVVKRGESLTQIAKRYGLNWRSLARANHISSPYQVRTGQRLTLKVPSGSSRQKRSQAAQSTGRSQTRSTTARSSAASSGAQTSRRTSGPSSGRVAAGNIQSNGWQWPASGTVSSDGNRKGVNIQGQIGAPVNAAAGGEVVYNGSGLKGYGKLIVIRHSNARLSAYAFINNSRVEKGQRVKSGQRIADVGKGPGNKPILRFEVRQNDRPVDPRELLSIQ